MKSVRQLAEEIVAREGGFVHDPDDRGGATNLGVTIGTMRALRRDIDGDGDVDVADLRGLTKAEAVEIFLRHYYQRPGIARLPMDVQPPLFDMYVNAGPNAVKILQRLLAARGLDCVDDGVIGPQTVAAALAFASTAPLGLAYSLARRDYYYALADARPASRKYARRRDGSKGGWILRAEVFLPPAHHLTEAQHQARIAAWQ